jgi:hypothetical protein
LFEIETEGIINWVIVNSAPAIVTVAYVASLIIDG